MNGRSRSSKSLAVSEDTSADATNLRRSSVICADLRIKFVTTGKFVEAQTGGIGNSTAKQMNESESSGSLAADMKSNKQHLGGKSRGKGLVSLVRNIFRT